MIYRKEANFPYPVLTQNSNSYIGSEFIIDVALKENNDNYRFEVSYTLECDFLNELIDKNRSELILVIQSKDNKFYELGKNQKYVDVPKNRISLSKRSSVQLLIKATEEINFKDNHELRSFYDELKGEIDVPKHSILAFSNICIFDGSLKKPYEIFEKKLNPSIKSDIKIELTSETIIINYRNEDLQFLGMNKSNTLNNPYIYMGLQKALFKFISNNTEGDEEVIYIDDMDVPSNELEFKLYNLMKSKLVDELSMENIDEVIYKITDRVLEKNAIAIKGLCYDGN